jgi:hypothetical protein
VQLEYPAGKVIYTGTGYMDYVRVSPSGKEVGFSSIRSMAMIAAGFRWWMTRATTGS